MQALQIHLNPQPTAMLGQGANVHGMNAPIRDTNSFDSYLQREMKLQTSKATDGPPENRNSVSDSPDSNTQSNSEPLLEKSQTEKSAVAEKESQTEKSAKTGDSKDSEKVGENDSPSEVLEKEGVKKELLLATENPADLLKLQTAVDVRTILTEKVLHGKNLEDVGTALLVGEDVQDVSDVLLVVEKLIDDEQSDTDTEIDDLFLAVLGVEHLNATEQVVAQKSFAVNAGDDATTKLDALETSKKSKQVLAEIPTISVEDERTVSAEAKSDGKFVNSVSHDGNGNATIDLSVNPNAANVQNTAGAIINADGSVQQHTATNAQQFGTMLSAELQSNSSELVKTGSIVLQDGNKGTINLILHPEELGNVKISLEISDNILNGRITVASEEAYNAFKANLASLRDAFNAEGFDTAGFDLTWSGQDNGQNAQDEHENQNTNPFGNRYDDNIAIIPDGMEMEGNYNSYGSRAYINVMA